MIFCCNKYMTDLRDEVGLKRWPRSIKEIKLSLEAHFLKRTNDEIDRLDLPALEPLAKRARMEFVNETKESQVDTPCMFLADSHIQVYQLCWTSPINFLFTWDFPSIWTRCYSLQRVIHTTSPVSRNRVPLLEHPAEFFFSPYDPG